MTLDDSTGTDRAILSDLVGAWENFESIKEGYVVTPWAKYHWDTMQRRLADYIGGDVT